MANEIKLAPLDRDHLPTLQRFRNSPEVYGHVRERRLLTMADMEKWWEMLAADGGQTVRMFAVARDTGLNPELGREYDLLGCAGLTSIDWLNRRAELSVYTVPSEYEVEAARLVIAHAFRDLGLHRIEAETLTQKREDLCNTLCFTCEGSRPDAYWRDGKFVDSLRWGLHADDPETESGGVSGQIAKFQEKSKT